MWGLGPMEQGCCGHTITAELVSVGTISEEVGLFELGPSEGQGYGQEGGSQTGMVGTAWRSQQYNLEGESERLLQGSSGCGSGPPDWREQWHRGGSTQRAQIMLQVQHPGDLRRVSENLEGEMEM